MGWMLMAQLLRARGAEVDGRYRCLICIRNPNTESRAPFCCAVGRLRIRDFTAFAGRSPDACAYGGDQTWQCARDRTARHARVL